MYGMLLISHQWVGFFLRCLEYLILWVHYGLVVQLFFVDLSVRFLCTLAIYIYNLSCARFIVYIIFSTFLILYVDVILFFGETNLIVRKAADLKDMAETSRYWCVCV